MQPLRFAMVGAGFWSPYQLAAWQELPETQCVAVCDRDRARAAKLAASRGVPAVYTDVAQMIEREQPDFLDIVTDVASHVPLVKLVVERKVPVICQKPMALTLDECEALVAACRTAGIPFAVHENWRWQTALRRVKELLVEGIIGTPFRGRIDMISGFDVFANQPNLRTETRFILADMGCHLFDLARSYFGEASTVVRLGRARLRRRAGEHGGLSEGPGPLSRERDSGRNGCRRQPAHDAPGFRGI